MKGDFSRWKPDELENFNFNGVLHQQGRVLTDEDWNARTRITNDWQDQTSRDAIGPAVAAVPSAVPGSFKVHGAYIDDVGTEKQVKVEIEPGRVWADGLLTYLESPNGNVERIATYLEPPVTGTAHKVDEIDDKSRDAVILEVWRESMNGFQFKDQLVEPALGGPDTTERVHTAMAFRLLRLESTDRCDTIPDKLKEDPSKRGRLIVTLEDTTSTDGECPMEQAGGYTGFEHHLFRIEIAKTKHSEPMFKWSRFNGGLVGQGKFYISGTDHKVTVTDNYQPITTCGLSSFYLEALQYDELHGHWQVIYGAGATLNGDNELELSTTPDYGTLPGSTDPLFFRLWDGIKRISTFVPANPPDPSVELTDSSGSGEGILLRFDKGTADAYLPGDYWNFEVRAGGIKNNKILVGSEDGTTGDLPHGIRYHRVPLAILSWKSDTIREPNIHDCRRIFRPLTDQEGCCTFTVGKGGDFQLIQEAIRHLPDQGGQICILPGLYKQSVAIIGLENITIKGCGKHTVIMPADDSGKPIFYIEDSRGITLEAIDMEAYGCSAVVMKGSKEDELVEVNITNNRILACISAVKVREGKNIAITGNTIRMLDLEKGEPAIYFHGYDSIIDDNDITVIPFEDTKPEPDDDIPDDETIPDPGDPCVDYERFFRYRVMLFNFLKLIWMYFLKFYPVKQFKTPGGIQVAGGCEDISIRGNHISGGYWNGITLGSLPVDSIAELIKLYGKYAIIKGIENPTKEVQKKLKESFDPLLYNLRIEENHIHHMGLNGIGSVAHFDLKSVGLLISVDDITIYRNTITDCLQQAPTNMVGSFGKQMAFGGISLPDVENLTLRENRIENNGNLYPGPVCGVFVQHGEKIDISDNRILNNGPKSLSTTDKGGIGGGVVIRWTFERMVQEAIQQNDFFSPDGIPSVKVHDNIITQPLGQALLIMAMGPVSVVDNHLTSQGIDARANPFSKLAGAVMILNLGVSADLFAALLLTTLKAIFRGKYTKHMAQPAPINTPGPTPMSARAVPPGGYIKETDTNIKVGLQVKQIDWGAIMEILLYLPAGNVMFANNQVNMDMRAISADEAICSQLLFTLDDIAYTGNQTLCTSRVDLTGTGLNSILQDSLFTDTLMIGATIRTNDNRFQEGVTRTWLSLISIGLLMNTCTINQATHCLIPLGLMKEAVKAGNLVLTDWAINEKFTLCDAITYSALQYIRTGSMASFQETEKQLLQLNL